MHRIDPQAAPDPAPPSLQRSRRGARRFQQRLILNATGAVALILTLAVMIVFNASAYQKYSQRTRHAYQVESQILRTSNALRRTETSLRDYLLTGNVDRLDIYYLYMPKIASESAKLIQLTTSTPAQQQRAKRLRISLTARCREIREVLTQYRHGHRQTGLQLFKKNMDEVIDHPIAEQVAAMREAEMQVLGTYEHQRENSARITTWLTVICLLAGLGFLVSAFILIMREQRSRLRSKERLIDTYTDLAQSLELARGMADRMQQLHSLGETLQSCRSMQEALRVIPDNLPGLLPDLSGALLLINASRNMVEKVAEWGPAVFEHEAIFEPDECLALRRGQAWPMTDSHAKFHCAHLHPDSAPGSDVDWVCIPLLAQGETLGIMHLQSSGPLDPDLRRLGITIGEQLSLMLGNLELQETLRIQSIRDPLTGLFNRRYLEVSLKRELLRSTRRDQELAVFMLDIDHFKRFNDTHGHDAGDALLQKFANLLQELVRGEDIACRYGGEEFTLILPETDVEVAMQRAEDIRKATAGLQINHRGNAISGITISLGVAMQKTHGNDPASLMQAADRALYRAKNTGRNRVELASPSTTGGVD